MEEEQGATEAIVVPDGVAGSVEAQGPVRDLLTHWRATRKSLTADELHDMVNATVSFEAEFPLPASSESVYLFTISGWGAGGILHSGCLLAGECMAVVAASRGRAEIIAADGLASTLEIMESELAQRPLVEASPVEAGLGVETGGRRKRADDGDLRTDPKMRHMIEHMIGGLPWKW